MRWFMILMAIAANAAHADGAADLKAALERLQEQAPLKATLDANVWRREGEGKEAEETKGQASVGIEEGARGMELNYSRGNSAGAGEKSECKSIKTLQLLQ